MKKALIINGLLYLLWVSVASAQTPSGYMGKRLIITYNNLSFPSLSESFNDRELKMKHKQNFEMEYIITRNKSVGLSTSIYNADILFEQYPELEYTVTDTNAWGDPISNNTYYYRPESGYLFAIHGGIFYRVFHENIAPLGIYSQFKIDGVFYEVTLNKLVNQSSDPQPPDIPLKDNYKSIMLGYGIGTQRVLFDRILLRFAINSGFVFGGLKITRFLEDDLHNIFEIGTGLNESNYVKRISKNTLLNHSLVNVALGIGFLVY